MKYFFIVFFIWHGVSYSQESSFDLFPTLGVGVPLGGEACKIYYQDHQIDLHRSPTFDLGLLGTYTLNKLLGIETGIRIREQYHAFRQTITHPFSSDLNDSGSVNVIDLQIPLLIFKNILLQRQPNRYFRVSFGTSLDWMNHDTLNNLEFKYLANLMLSFKYMILNRYGREMALEICYTKSLRPYHLKVNTQNGVGADFKGNVHSLNLAFYFSLVKK